MQDELQSHITDEHITLGQACNSSAAHTRSCKAMTRAGMDTCVWCGLPRVRHAITTRCWVYMGDNIPSFLSDDLSRERAEGPAATPFSLVKAEILVLNCHFRLKPEMTVQNTRVDSLRYKQLFLVLYHHTWVCLCLHHHHLLGNASRVTPSRYIYGDWLLFCFCKNK